MAIAVNLSHVPRGMIDRVLVILNTFDRGHEQQRLTDISRRCGLPLATTYRILQRLAVWGMLERTVDGNYQIGLRLWELGSLAPRSMELQHIARPFMHDLHTVTGFTVHLGIREGEEMVSVERFVSPAQRKRRPLLVGRRNALHTTAIGQVLLAYAPRDVQEQVLAGPLTPVTPYTCTDPRELRRMLERIRDQGYAISDRQINLTQIGVAAPVYAHGTGPIAALSVMTDLGLASTTSMTQAVRVTAAGITRALRQATAHHRTVS